MSTKVAVTLVLSAMTNEVVAFATVADHFGASEFFEHAADTLEHVHDVTLTAFAN